MSPNHENFKKILHHFDDVTLKLIQEDPEFAKEVLREHGMDPQKELAYGLQQIKKLKFIAQAKQKQERDQNLLQQAFEKLRHLIKENEAKAGEALQMALRSSAPKMQYRNLKEWKDEEIREVLNDVDLLELLEELDKENR